jgi:hypothetical protein
MRKGITMRDRVVEEVKKESLAPKSNRRRRRHPEDQRNQE